MNKTLGAFLLTFVLAASAVAAPVSIGLAGFSGSETVVTFNSIGDEVLVDTQFAGLGVTFSGPVFGMTNNGDITFIHPTAVESSPPIGDTEAPPWGTSGGILFSNAARWLPPFGERGRSVHCNVLSQ